MIGTVPRTAKKSAPVLKAAPAQSPTDKKNDQEDLIRTRAHQIYLARIAFGTPGDAESDWRQAEQELLNSGQTRNAVEPT
jgi:hypothetical protein